MSLKEYEKINEIALKQQEETKYQEYKNAVNNADENAAKYKREQHKVFKVKEAKSVIETIEDTVAVKPFLCEGARIGDWQEVIKCEMKFLYLLSSLHNEIILEKQDK